MESKILGTIKPSNHASFSHRYSMYSLSLSEITPNNPTEIEVIKAQSILVSKKTIANPMVIVKTVFEGLPVFLITLRD